MLLLAHKDGENTYVPLETAAAEIAASFRSPANGAEGATFLADLYDPHVPTVVYFGGSVAGNDPAYATDAYALGLFVAAQGWQAVYGGGSSGTMGSFANGVIDGGGRILGVQPKCFFNGRVKVNNERPHPGLAATLVVPDMSTRKNVMFSLTNPSAYPGRGGIVLVGPGGDGTSDEIFEAITYNKIGIQSLNMYYLDTRGNAEALSRFLAARSREGFSNSHIDPAARFKDPAELIRKICSDYGFELKPLPPNLVRSMGSPGNRPTALHL